MIFAELDKRDKNREILKNIANIFAISCISAVEVLFTVISEYALIMLIVTILGLLLNSVGIVYFIIIIVFTMKGQAVRVYYHDSADVVMFYKPWMSEAYYNEYLEYKERTQKCSEK